MRWRFQWYVIHSYTMNEKGLLAKSPFCGLLAAKQTFCQKQPVFGLVLPQKVLFHSWYMNVWHTIGLVISRAFSLNIFENLKYCLIQSFLLSYMSHQMLCYRRTSWLTIPIPTSSTTFHWCQLKFFWFNFFYLHLCWALKYDC